MRQAIVQSPSYKWWVFATIGLGTFISVVDHGSVNVALPRIESHFDTDLPTVQWVVVGYALTISVLLLPMGRLGDMFSRKPVYITGLAIFVVSALLAGSAQNIPMLIGFKVLQGAGSAMVQGNGMATIISVFPGTERGKALGTHLSVVGTGAIVGPALGGVMVSALGWRSVFFVAAAVGVAAIAAAVIVLDRARLAQQQAEGQRPKFDWPGAAMSGGTLLLFLLVMTNGHRAGWTSAPIALGLLGGVLMLAAFIWWELRTPSPMLELRLFKRKLVAFGIAAGWLSFMGSSAIIFMMPFYLQKVQGYSPREAGLIVVPTAVCLAIMGPISGRLSDRFGWRKFNMGGLALSATGVFLLSTTLTETSPLLLIIPILMLSGIGMGLFNSPNNSSILSAVERHRYGVVSALTQLTRNSANVTSIALATTIVVVTMASMGFEPSLSAVTAEGGGEVARAFVSGLRRAYLVMGSLLVVGIVISFFKGERVREPAAESPAAVPAGKPS